MARHIKAHIDVKNWDTVPLHNTVWYFVQILMARGWAQDGDIIEELTACAKEDLPGLFSINVSYKNRD